MTRYITSFLLTLVAGCDRIDVVYSESKYPPDEYFVMESALRYMLDKHSSSPAERKVYSAYLIDGGGYSSELADEFKGYKPEVKSGVGIKVSTESGVAKDAKSGKEVKLWTVKVEKLIGDRATASVEWYSGKLAAGHHTLHLRRTDGKWVVESEKMDWIS